MTELDSEYRAMRVAVVIPTHWAFRMGGSQYQAKLLVERLHDEYGAEVAYFAARVPETRQFRDHKVICVGRNDRLRKYGHFWDYFRLQEALEKFAPHVIYQRVSCSYTGIAAAFSRRSGVPLVWHIASDKDCQKGLGFSSSIRRPHAWLEARLAEFGVKNADVIVAQTEDQICLLRENFGRRADRLVRNFHPVPDKSGKRKDILTVVWIANFKPLKRPELFLDIAARLTEEVGIEFLMVGQPYLSGSLQTEFDDRIRAMPSVQCLGELSQDQVNALLERAHLLINTSKWEGFSNTFIQAWMRSVPVLTLGVNPDGLLNREGLGWCLGSIEELAKVVSEVSANPDMLQAIGERARRFAIRNFSLKNASELAGLLVKNGRDVMDLRAES